MSGGDYTQTVAFLVGNISANGSVTASTTQTQGQQPLGKGFTRVDAVANDNDVVTLPTSDEGVVVVVKNDDTAQILQLYPEVGDRIDGAAVDSSILVHPKQTIFLWSTDGTSWYSFGRDFRSSLTYTASTTQTQAGGTPITTEIANVTAVSNDDDAVTLFPVYYGAKCWVRNDDTAQYLQIFPASGNRIDGRGDNESITIGPNSSVLFHGSTNIRWKTLRDERNARNGFTADAGQAQGGSPLYYGFTTLSVVSTNGDSVTLPPAEVGATVQLTNFDNAQYAAVFPSSGDSIDFESTDVPINISPGQTILFWATTTSQWRTNGFRRRSTQTVTASVTQTQAGGTPVWAEVANVSNIGSNDDAVTLYPVRHGDFAAICNTDANQVLQIFPAVGDDINDTGTNLSIRLNDNQAILLVGLNQNDWREIGEMSRRNFGTVGSFTADPAQTQGTGVLDYGYTRITTVASDGNSLTLPPADRDKYVVLDNTSQNSDAQLFPASGDRIDNGSTNAAITLYAGQIMMLRATGQTDWWTVLKTPGSADSITAFSGGGQASATLLAAGRNRLTTVAANGDSVKLPPAQAGEEVWVYNDGNNSADVFPNTADAINDLGNDNAIALAANTGLIFHAFSSSRWNTW